MNQTYQTLHLSAFNGHGVVLALNRPDAANALNSQMAQELTAFFSSMDPAWRAVVLTGQGRHFCAGADLKERRGMDEAAWYRQHEDFEAARQALADCPLPVIAAVRGAAYGGGLELALACDFLYASEDARFALPEATLGIIPGLGGTQALPRVLGMARARELLFTGRAFTAGEAFAWGMVNRLCDPDRVLEEAVACADAIAANAPLAVKALKKAMREGEGLKLDEALAVELRHYHDLLPTRDRREGVNAFNEKRKPRFSGE